MWERRERGVCESILPYMGALNVMLKRTVCFTECRAIHNGQI